MPHATYCCLLDFRNYTVDHYSYVGRIKLHGPFFYHEQTVRMTYPVFNSMRRVYHGTAGPLEEKIAFEYASKLDEILVLFEALGKIPPSDIRWWDMDFLF